MGCSMFSSEEKPPTCVGLLAPFLKPEELADALGVSRRTLDRWHAQRLGPARCQVGKLILYRVDAVRDWLSGLEPGPARRSPRGRR